MASWSIHIFFIILIVSLAFIDLLKYHRQWLLVLDDGEDHSFYSSECFMSYFRGIVYSMEGKKTFCFFRICLNVPPPLSLIGDNFVNNPNVIGLTKPNIDWALNNGAVLGVYEPFGGSLILLFF